jgi:hypothetical protein
MKIQIKYTIESIYDTPNQNIQERIFICNVRSMYEWRLQLIQAVNLSPHEEIFVHEIKELR